MRHTLLLAASLIALSAAARAEAPFDFDHTPGKLPKTVVPQAYRIDILPDLEKLTLAGTETIAIMVRSPTTTITMNQAGLTLAKATLETGAPATIAADEKAQTVTLTFPQPIPAGAHTLAIAYNGPIPNTPSGIYYDDYKTPAGASKRMLVTQFEVADARRMFPGWDEPAFKATFQLSVTLPRNLAVVSNMPIATTTPAAGTGKHVVFATTPKMSTYLLALIAGDMAAIHAAAGPTQLAVWAPTGEEGQGAYALDAEKKILPYYNTYFGVPYPLPKLDMIAIPGNYAAGAMENWGAITYIDNTLLYDQATSSPSTRETIFLDVAHEMAHQWSGDLVTMGWWDNIWLNEGFATWMENKATDHFNPDWQILPREHSDREDAMGQDGISSTHPIQQVIKDETQADSAFDQISYKKGEQIIRMVEDWLGPDVFRDGMRRYMKAHQYGNATSADLWAALSAASHKDVAAVASGFTEQPGIPLVHMARACENGNGELHFSQDRFAINDPHVKPESWTIPVSFGIPGGPVQHTLLTATPATIDFKPACGDAAIKVNLSENGYYRTQYDAQSLQDLNANFAKLGAADRANLLGDEFALFRADRAPLTEFLNLLGNLAGEQNAAVWEYTLKHLALLHRSLVGSPELAPFDAYAVRIIRPEFDRLGWDAKPGEPFLASLLRPQIVNALGLHGDKDVVAEANRRFKAFLTDPASLPAALREPVLNIVGHHADQATYDALKKLGIAATSTEEKLRAFYAMARAADPALVKETAAFADASQVPNGRIEIYLMNASLYSDSPDLLAKLVQANEDKLSRHIAASGFGQTVFSAAAVGSTDPATAQALLADKSSASSTGAHIGAMRVANIIKNAAELRARTEAEVAAWLKEAPSH